jgi:hypothetical protein
MYVVISVFQNIFWEKLIVPKTSSLSSLEYLDETFIEDLSPSLSPSLPLSLSPLEYLDGSLPRPF